MIRKLRLKFIIINMSVVTLMLCVILGLVYQFTKTNLETANLRTMQNIADHPLSLGIPKEPGEEVRLPYFVLQVGEQGEVLASGGYYDLTDREFLAELADTVIGASERHGILEDYDLRYYRMDTPLKQYVVFTDISSELAALRSLMRNCLIIGIVSFLIFLGISIRLAKWAVKPVDTAWKQQRQFVADASHELKTPLTVIMTNAELLQNPEFDGESCAKFSRNILTMSRQMRGLIEQMLNLAKTEQAQPETVKKPVDFSKLVSNAVLPFEPVFLKKELVLKTEICDNIIVKGVESQLRQLPEILLDNAQKYAKSGGTAWIRLEIRRRGHCLLTVANEGEMIPPDELKHIFKRFYRADKVRSSTGSFGLGLSIAERIVAQHRGKIRAESRAGINSFYVELRCSKAD